MVQRDGAELVDGAQLDWYPNDSPENRLMQFRFQVEVLSVVLISILFALA